jgi:hypothetical protein
MAARIDGLMDGWMDGWLVGWMDGWMDGCANYGYDNGLQEPPQLV